MAFQLVSNGTRKSSVVRRCMGSSVEIAIGRSAQEAVVRGCDQLANVVAVTLGPKGRNVLIEQPWGGPKMTKDGVSVAKRIELPDKLENLGAQLVKQVSINTNEQVGDGTTTATVLARELVKEGVSMVGAGVNPMEILKGIKEGTSFVLEYLARNATPVKGNNDIRNIATVSANGDDTIGRLVAQAIERVGADGIVTVEDGKTIAHELELTTGFKFDRGLLSPYFATEPKSGKCEFDNVSILLVDGKLNTINPLVPLLEETLSEGVPLVIVAEDVDSDLLATLVLNRLRSGLKIALVKAPGFGEFRKNILEDLAMVLNTKVVSFEQGDKLSDISLSKLGKAKKVSISREETVILEGQGSTASRNTRADTIKYQLTNDKKMSDYEREKLKERLARLTGGVALIRVGGASELEIGEAKDRINDALCATRSAAEEGILPGGGTALLFAGEELSRRKVNPNESDGFRAGINLVRKAVTAPVKQIVANAGLEGAVVAANILRNNKLGHGFDAREEIYCDMLTAGIVDPAKVVRTALQDATSIAALMLTTQAVVYTPPAPVGKSSDGNSSASPGMGNFM